jgi:hypothetical protein
MPHEVGDFLIVAFLVASPVLLLRGLVGERLPGYPTQ